MFDPFHVTNAKLHGLAESFRAGRIGVDGYRSRRRELLDVDVGIAVATDLGTPFTGALPTARVPPPPGPVESPTLPAASEPERRPIRWAVIVSAMLILAIIAARVWLH